MVEIQHKNNSGIHLIKVLIDDAFAEESFVKKGMISYYRNQESNSVLEVIQYAE